MTMNPKYFISYRRAPARAAGDTEALRLRDALRDRGIRTWRDLDNLGAEPTESELTATLQDPETVGAILLISPEVRDSSVIRNVEARRIFQRKANDSTFLVIPVLLGLNYSEADDVLGSPAGFQNVNNWNLHRVPSGELSEEDARRVASAVLRHRTAAIAAANDLKELHVGLFSRRVAGAASPPLRLNYAGYFDGRSCPDGTFSVIERAILDAATAITETIPTRNIVGQGYASLPIGVLFGAVFSPLAGFELAWMQAFDGKTAERWSHAVDRSDADARVTVTEGDVASNDIVLALGVSANVETSVAGFLRSTGTSYRVALNVGPSDGPVPQGVALTPADGVSLVNAAIDAVRQSREDLGLASSRLHLFLACPLSMAVLLGQKLNTFGRCVLYEHDPDSPHGYQRVHTFNPSGFSYSPAD